MTPKISVIMPIIITEKWHEYVTETSIKVHRENTKIPFELIIVETESNKCKNLGEDKYIHHSVKEGYGKDFNTGIDISTGDFIVHTANDIFPQPGWLEALLQCFEIKNCGVALLGSKELNHIKQNLITESVSCPQLMMFRSNFRFDEAYKNVAVDNDLIMQVYEKGFTSYRNYSVLYHHLGAMTATTMFNIQQLQENTQKAMDYFKDKYKDSPLLMYRLIAGGQMI